MTIYDGIMIVLVVVAVIQGAWRGMIWQVAPIASLVLGYIVSYPMSLSVAQYFGEPPLNRLWAMIAIYAAVSLAVYLVLRSVRESFDRLKLTEFDRHLGAILGLVKGGLLAIVITIGLITVSPQARELILKSESSTIAARTVNTISPILPKALNDLVRPYIKNFNDQLPPEERDQRWPIVQSTGTTRSTKIIARKDSLSKPKTFSDNDGYLPQDVPPQDPPPRNSSGSRSTTGSRSRLSTEPPARQPADDDFFGPFDPPRNAPSSGRNTPPRREPVPEPVEDDFGLPAPAPKRTPRTTEPPNRAPQLPPEDDFFTADPNKALPR